MGKIVTTKIERFDGGIANDPRDPRGNVARVITNFDVLTDPRRMKPYRNSESGDSGASTALTQNWCIALGASSTYKIFGLGRQTALDRVLIRSKELTTGAPNDLDDAGWSTLTKGEGGQATPNYNLFVFYRKTGYIYGAHTGTHIYRHDPTDSGAFVDTHQAVTYTHIGQGVVHSEDDILYIPAYNSAASAGARSFIISNNNGSWDNSALALPDHLMPTSVFEHGNYLGIVCADVNGVGNSKVILWDRDSLSWNEMYDLGESSAIIGEDLQGTIVTIAQSGGTTSSYSGIPSGSIRHKEKIIIRFFPSNGADTIELEGTDSTVVLAHKQKINERLYFMASITLNGTVREGLWSVGRNKLGQWSLVHERTPNNDTALTSGVMRGFFIVGDYVFQAYVDNGTHAVSKTNDTEAYATSIWESKIYDGGDATQKKDLLGLSLSTEPLDDSPATSADVYYKKDNESSYTQLFTHDVDGEISYDAIRNEDAGTVLPKDYKEIQFKIESTGATITSFGFQEEITGKKTYNG